MDEAALAIVEAVFSIGLAALVAALTRAAARGDLKRNDGIGIRSKTTMRSDATWTAAHQAALPWMIRTAIVITLVAVVGVLLVAIDHHVTGEVLVYGENVVLLVGMVIAQRKATRAANAVPEALGDTVPDDGFSQVFLWMDR